LGLRREDALPNFNVILKYENPLFEEVVSVEAVNSADAREVCRFMKESIEARMSFLESVNVYCSKVLKSCDLASRTRQEELESLSFLKEDV
jgi:hypothetical protein